MPGGSPRPPEWLVELDFGELSRVAEQVGMIPPGELAGLPT